MQEHFTAVNTDDTEESQRSQKVLIAEKKGCPDVPAPSRNGNRNIEHGPIQSGQRVLS